MKKLRILSDNANMDQIIRHVQKLEIEHNRVIGEIRQVKSKNRNIHYSTN
jgi:hypothetical protein